MYIKYSRQIKRFESVSRSPIYAFFGESLNGISTIRAFNAESRYLKQMQAYLDDNSKIFLNNLFGNRYSLFPKKNEKFRHLYG